MTPTTATHAPTPAPAPSAAPATAGTGSPFGWALADTLTITGRTLQHWARQPGVFALNLLFPVFTLVMFGYLFGGAMTVPGGGDYREFLVPGVLGLSVSTVNRLADAGKLPTARKFPGLRGARLYNRTDVEALKATAS